ncbi:MAG TPA: hypothetical protein VEK78_13840 [Gemmatimonadales bacterium]|nr:hypothetical protein [Gemmatimonadales bacterium]
MLRLVIPLAPEHDDLDAPAQVADPVLWIAPLLLVVAPEGIWDLTTRPCPHTT